jgi:hypothetical protein
VVTAVGSAGLYNFLFTEPRYTFAITPDAYARLRRGVAGKGCHGAPDRS